MRTRGLVQTDRNCVSVFAAEINLGEEIQSDNVNLSLFLLLPAQRQKQTQAGNQE